MAVPLLTSTKKLQKRYASYNDRTGYPKMWNGPMMKKKFPRHYMGFIVSSDVVFSLYKDGRGTVGLAFINSPIISLTVLQVGMEFGTLVFPMACTISVLT